MRLPDVLLDVPERPAPGRAEGAAGGRGEVLRPAMTDQPAAAGNAPMIGAHALIASLVGAGVDVCFMNPGTSEMHFVHSLDAVPRMRGVLGLFEGVATGAADGYARISGRPAAVLLHLGPGLGNGLANLHNARRAHTPVVCIVGAHATGHVRFDAPLQSDIEAVARTVSGWVRTSTDARDVAHDAIRAVAASLSDGGQVATLVLPADVSWGTGGVIAEPRPAPQPDPVTEPAVGMAASIVLGHVAVGAAARRAGTIRARPAGCQPRRGSDRHSAACRDLPGADGMRRGPAGRGPPALPSRAGRRSARGTDHLVLAGARSPVAFFAYPGRSGDLVPAGCSVLQLADRTQDVETALERLAALVAARAEPVLAAAAAEPAAPGPLTLQSLATAIAATLPENAIVVDEANTSGIALPAALAGAARHSLLTLTGGRLPGPRPDLRYPVTTQPPARSWIVPDSVMTPHTR